MNVWDCCRWRHAAWASVICVLPGCSANQPEPTEGAVSPPVAGRATTDAGAARRSTRRELPVRPRRQIYSARTGAAENERTALTSEEAVGHVLATVRDSVDFAPTLVVWLIDVSPSAMRWGSDVRDAIRQFYDSEVPQLVARKSDRLESALWTISRSVDTPAPQSSDAQDIVRAIDALRTESSGREVTFEAIRQAMDEYLPVRTQQRREVLFVVVTDEAGDDWTMVDQLVHLPRKFAMPVYVIGVPAPFGRSAALSDSVEGAATEDESSRDVSGASNVWRPILQGPESRGLERIQLKFSAYEEDLDLVDSGFGPYGLERLCRASGGSFLAVRRSDSRDFAFDARQRTWPSFSLVSPDPTVMWRYLPDPLGDAAYQAQLEGNRARKALAQAAQLPPAEVLRDPQLLFVKRTEADLKNRLDKAQQAAAKVAPAVDRLYEMLREGAADAEQLTRPRWRAGFALALGRACAAKARIDGYNSMLAALKRGKNFEDEASTSWVLQRTATIEGSSSLRKLAERAVALLQGVVDDHPNTPWAKVAAQELSDPMGWTWTEQR